jgi:hypothetical protein
VNNEFQRLRITCAITFAIVALPIACVGSLAQQTLAPSTAQPRASIEFVYPHANEVFTDYPISIETKVTGCDLVPPVQYWSSVELADAAIGHIHYTLDDSPIFATESKQVVLSKPPGKSLPIGKHILRAELVYINHERRNPPVFVEIPIVCERPQPKSGAEPPAPPVLVDDRTRRELLEVEKQLKEVQQQLQQLKSNAREVPNP